jgi:hypothetical protein
MPTWAEVQQYARNKYRLAKDEPERFAILFGMEGGRTQQIWVRTFNAHGGQPFIEYRSYFCKEGELQPIVALRKNAEMATGFIALLGDHYAVMWNVALNQMDAEEFELPLQAIAWQAEQLEKLYSAGNDEF